MNFSIFRFLLILKFKLLVQEFFQLLGLYLLASVFSLILTIVIAILVTWTYSRYSGHLRDTQKSIDTMVKNYY